MDTEGETPRTLLERLLLGLFDADGLRRYLTLGPEGETVAAELEVGGTTRDLVHSAVGVLIRRGQIDVAFFDRLRGEFPGRRQDVRTVCARWIRSRPIGTPCPTIAASDGPYAALGERLEEAYRRREDVIVSGGDSAQIDVEIRELRRELRRGAQLRPGEGLSAGRYRLLEVLGRGGFAMVWKAYDRETRSVVAVKVLHGQWNDDRSRRERFQRGARGMLQLHHAAIVRVLREPIEDEGFWFYVMEWIDGPSLHQAVLAGRVGWPAALAILTSVCEALIYAHQRRIVHRDVKPANILIDRDGRSYLTDFDLLMADHTTGGTDTGAGLGTLFYAAAEALSDASRVDARADVYSLGKTLMFCWLGRDLRAHEDVGSQPDHQSMPEGVRAVLARATAAEAGERYPSVEALREALVGLVQTSEVDSARQGALVFERRLETYVSTFTAGARVEDTYLAGGGSLVVRTASLRAVEVDALVSVVDVRAPGFGAQAAAVARAGGGEFTSMLYEWTLWRRTTTGMTMSVIAEELAAGRVLQFHIGQDLVAPTPTVCEQIVANMVGACLQTCVNRGHRTIAFPAWFRLAADYSTEAGLRDLFTHAMRFLTTSEPAIDRVEILLPEDPSLCELPSGEWPSSIREHSVIVDWTQASGGRIGRVPFPLGRHADVASWLAAVGYWVPRRPDVSSAYGVGWALRRVDHEELLAITADDLRVPAAAGLVPGLELAAVLLPGNKVGLAPPAPIAGTSGRAQVVIADQPGARLFRRTVPASGSALESARRPTSARRSDGMEGHTIGAIDVVVEKGDICLEAVDAVVASMSEELVLGDAARALVEFAGPAVFDPLAALPRCAPGDLFMLPGGRLPARRILLAASDPLGRGAAAVHRSIALAVRRAFRRAADHRMESLAFVVLFAGSASTTEDECRDTLVKACLAAAGGESRSTLQTVRIVIADDGEALRLAGGQCVLEVLHPYVRGYNQRQRFMLGRYACVQYLLDVIFMGLPLPVRPPSDTYGVHWLIRRRVDGWVVDPKFVLDPAWSAKTPHEAGIRPEDVFEFVALSPRESRAGI